MKKKILVIGTGGTIASKQSKKGLVPLLSAEELVSHVPSVKKYAEISSIQVSNLDSTDITQRDWLNFAKTIEDNSGDYDGFVLCHGTDTLAYTAAALSYLIQASPKPIVITGSQKPIDAEDTDARRNLRDSILYASSENSAGVTIVFDGKVIAGTRAKKEKTKSYDAFSSINYPYLAIIRDDKVIQYIKEEDTHGPIFYRNVSDRILALKLAPGFDAELLPILFDRYECIIIESFGLGGIPTYLMEEFAKQMEKADTLVIVSTQVINEGSDMSIYEVGLNAKTHFNLLETYDMTPESAFSKICWLLGREDLDREKIREQFYAPIGHDITAL